MSNQPPRPTHPSTADLQAARRQATRQCIYPEYPIAPDEFERVRKHNKALRNVAALLDEIVVARLTNRRDRDYE